MDWSFKLFQWKLKNCNANEFISFLQEEANLEMQLLGHFFMWMCLSRIIWSSSTHDSIIIQ